MDNYTRMDKDKLTRCKIYVAGVIAREVDDKAVMEDNHFVGAAKVVKNT